METHENPQDVRAVEPAMGMVKVRLNRARNLKGPEILKKRDCYVVFTFEKRRAQTTTKYNDIGPLFNEEFIFEKVPYPPSSKLAITVVYQGEKRDEVLGVAAPGHHYWTVGGTAPKDHWMPISTKEGMYAGELSFSIHWIKDTLKLRAPFRTLAKCMAPIELLSRPVNRQINLLVDGLIYLYTVLKNKKDQMSGNGVVVSTFILGLCLAGLCAPLIIPAVIFFPITFVFVIGGGVVALALGPLVLAVSAFLFCSSPVQEKLVKPIWEKMLRHDSIKIIFTESEKKSQ